MASFTILYTPQGQPWQVPLSEVERFLALGYRRSPSLALASAPAGIAPAAPELETAETDDRVRINLDSIARLTKLPSVGTATAREVVKGRPYASIEDLIDRVPLSKEGASWAALESLISFEAADDAAE